MNECARQLLLKLLNSWQAKPESRRAVSLSLKNSKRAASFHAISDYEERERAIHALEDAEKRGCIRLVHGKFEESHLIDKIELTDGPLLAELLGETLAVDKASGMRSVLDQIVSGRYWWISEAYQESVEKWRLGKSTFEISPHELERATDLFKALEAVAAGLHVDMDMRTFSAKNLGNSKAFEQMKAKFASVWRRQPEYANLDTDELLQAVGIQKYPWPLMVRGSIVVHFSGATLNTKGIGPYLGVPITEIDGIEFEMIPGYVLFIENFASFNRYVHEVKDTGLVMYTNGFPSPSLSSLISMVDAALPEDVLFYHWGDIDGGGLMIFRKVEELSQHHVLAPHLMSFEILSRYGKVTESKPSHSLKAIASSDSRISGLARSILALPQHMTLEQEILDPLAPLLPV